MEYDVSRCQPQGADAEYPVENEPVRGKDWAIIEAGCPGTLPKISRVIHCNAAYVLPQRSILFDDKMVIMDELELHRSTIGPHDRNEQEHHFDPKWFGGGLSP